jgi:hypothetical protein
MTMDNIPDKPKRSFWRRFAIGTMRAVVVLAVLGLAAYAITSYWAARSIRREVARIRAAGEPTTFAELDARMAPVDRAQDAGPWYTAAAELTDLSFEADNANHALFDRKTTEVPADVLERARRSLEQNRIALDLLDRGSALPGCNYDIQLRFGFEPALPRMSMMRSLLDVASLRTRVLALDGQGDRAADSAISALGVLRTMDREPVLLSTLVKTAMLDHYGNDLRYVLERGHPSDAALLKLGDAMRRAHVIGPREMFVAERVFFLEIVRNAISMGTGEVQPDGASVPPKMWSSLGISGRITAARGLSNYVRRLRAAGDDWPGMFHAIQLDTSDSARLWEEDTARSMVLLAKQISVYRSAIAAIEVERFRRAHGGQLPDSLSQLPNADELPGDPFTGRPLMYIKTADGYCVFSAGRGHPEDSNVDRDKDPITWSERWGIHIGVRAP